MCKVMKQLAVLDMADLLENEEIMAGYLSEIIATEDSDLVLSAICDIARAKGMTSVVEKAGFSREALDAALSPGASPDFALVLQILRALGLKLLVALPDVLFLLGHVLQKPCVYVRNGFYLAGEEDLVHAHGSCTSPFQGAHMADFAVVEGGFWFVLQPAFCRSQGTCLVKGAFWYLFASVALAYDDVCARAGCPWRFCRAKAQSRPSL